MTISAPQANGIVSVSVELLFAGFGSLTPPGAVTIAVLLKGLVAVELTVPVNV
jgi:hypothetical protein